MGKQISTPRLDEEARDLLSLASRRIEIAFWQGDFERAIRIVAEARQIFDDCQDRRAPDLDDPISMLGLDSHVITVLETMGINVIGQLLWTSQNVFFEQTNFGVRSWDKIEEALRRCGYEHGGDQRGIRRLAKNGFKTRKQRQ